MMLVSPFALLWMAACSPDPLLALDVEQPVDVTPPVCQTSADCDEGFACWVDPTLLQSRCVPACEEDSDCPGDQLCRTMFDTTACVDPLPEPPPDVPRVDGATPQVPADVQCIGPVSGAVDIPFTVEDDTTSVMVVPFATDGGQVRPSSLLLPTDQVLAIQGSASFLGVTASLLGYTAPLFLPQSPIAEEVLIPGSHVYTVVAETQELCSYVLTETADAGRRLDLNLYFVGLSDLDSTTAAQDADLANALNTFAEVYASAGIQLGDVRAFDASPEVANEFAVIDDRADLDELVATSQPPGPDDASLTSVNVFFVAAIAIPDSGAIGISQGIPGPVGLHGTPGSGVVLTSEFLRLGSLNDATLGAQLTGVVLAHEVGHWLGLFHTSELAGGVQDPIPDTVGCDDIAERFANDQLDGCPDRNNLMFPVADPFARDLTAQQGGVLVANPVTR
ncbi:MAG: hypothetical protein AAGA48_34700 [Myxococcota bacterium]